MMKYLIKYMLSGIFFLTAVCSCTKAYEETYYLAVDHAAIDFPFTAGHSYVQVYSTGGWTVGFADGTEPSWCHLDKTSGSGRGSFRIDVDDNLSGSDRSVTVSVTRGETSREIQVRQKTVI